MRVYSEEVKQQHVGHWDLDYLTREEFEELFGEPDRCEDS